MTKQPIELLRKAIDTVQARMEQLDILRDRVLLKGEELDVREVKSLERDLRHENPQCLKDMQGMVELGLMQMYQYRDSLIEELNDILLDRLSIWVNTLETLEEEQLTQHPTMGKVTEAESLSEYVEGGLHEHLRNMALTDLFKEYKPKQVYELHRDRVRILNETELEIVKAAIEFGFAKVY